MGYESAHPFNCEYRYMVDQSPMRDIYVVSRSAIFCAIARAAKFGFNRWCLSISIESRPTMTVEVFCSIRQMICAAFAGERTLILKSI